MSIIYINDYKQVHYRVVVKHTHMKPLLTYTDTDVQTNKVIRVSGIRYIIYTFA